MEIVLSRETRMLRLILPTIAVLALSASPILRSPNLISNGGFESGDGGINGRQAGIGSGWEVICGGPHPEIYTLDSRVKHSGKHSQRMTCDGYNYRFLKEGGYCYHLANCAEVRHPCPTELGLQAIAQTTGKGVVRPGGTYECSAWVKIEGLTQSWEWFRIGIYWLDHSGKFIRESREDHETSRDNYGTHDWKKIRVRAAAPNNAAYAKVYLHHHFVHGTVWYDDVELRATR